ncbi:MAG TPA: TetR/AcrR family transcriptional regulator [Bryobacteraceae bacterium]|nr:TetR/AcrR family transcriptional regulator [Bryobacteraceae bacterium]
MEVAARSKKNQYGRQHRSDGERSRQAILKAASELATVEGLEGLSIARLADYVGMSKSGLFAHFKSKEELQLATIDTASAIFDREVFEPALAASPGLARVMAFCEAFFSHLERRVFPGGCFFISVAAEFDAKSGAVRDYALAAYSRVLAKANEFFCEAQEKGELDNREDIAQLSFELYSFLLSVNFAHVFFRDPTALARGRESIRQRLARAMPSKRTTRKRSRGAKSRTK